MSVVLRVKNITKEFRVYERQRDRLKEIFQKKPLHKKFFANRDISFDLHSGESLGIVGLNGAGKSTLLKIISGVLMQTSGSIEADGSVAAILELGTGFNYDLSGVENIYFNGYLLGMSKAYIDENLQNIIDFSELNEFIKMPIGTYSSGMAVRLAFSIAIFSNAQIFIIDEALSVGDAHFSQKCIKKLKDIKSEGKSIIFVSHDLNSLKLLCDRIILLRSGKVVQEGDPQDVLDTYNYLITEIGKIDENLKELNSDYGSKEAIITNISMKKDSSDVSVTCCGDSVNFEIEIHSNKDLKDLSLGFLIKDKFGQDIYGTNTNLLGIDLDLKQNKRYVINLYLKLDIGVGFYTVTLALHSKDTHVDDCYHWMDNALRFEVINPEKIDFIGICRLNSVIDIKEING
ncbi:MULTISPECIES: ABC transporter ATP-binding protein [unclassified Campylobacter]|uniref:ABC transporter ATP-binding protein n=1 Tax=unclassified Campylobacter TaxID=2593542 RepID=UPI0014728603|nr:MULTISPECIES: ABC transporter ATP-binding protein [unclassified Campylobacter]